MTDTAMSRSGLPTKKITHPGLLLERGFPLWKKENDKRGEAIADHISNVSALKVTEIYKQAYSRWHKQQLESKYSQVWFGKLENSRLFIGLGEPSSIEATLTLHHTYGTPVIPGSAIKGAVRAHALRQGIDGKVCDFMFGKEPDLEQKSAEHAGYLIFNDAWWVPGSADTPLVAEVVTVHHAEYYKGEGKPATDFDPPNPNSQVATRGSFLFSIEGMGNLVAWGFELLKEALQEEGIGAKSAAGYGYFVEDEKEARAGQTVRDDKEALKIQEEQAQKLDDDIKQMCLTGNAEKLYRESKQDGWEQDNEKFLKGAEDWLPKLALDDDIESQIKVASYLAEFLGKGKKNKGIMDDPEKVAGKKKKPAYNERPKALAITLRQILGIS